MVTLLYKKKEYNIPSEYNELTGEQLIKLAPLLHAGAAIDIVCKLKVLQILMGMSTARFYFMSLDLRDRALNYIHWIFEKNTLTKQLLPCIKGYYGPKAYFDNLTLEEYHCAEIFYSDLIQEKDEHALNKLIAVLYRKPKSLFYNQQKDPSGDIRTPFNEHEIEYWAKKINSWPVSVKQAILIWYDGCREHLISLYSLVFTPDANSTSESDTRGMFGVMRQIADGSKYGQFDQVKKMNIHTALLEMEQLIKEAAEANKISKL